MRKVLTRRAGIKAEIMHDLTARQVDILKSLIEEYIETAEPVGSENA